MAQQFTDHIFFQIALFERQSFLDRGQIGDVLAPTLSQGQDSQLHAGPPSCCTSDQTCQIVFAQRVSIQRARKKNATFFCCKVQFGRLDLLQPSIQSVMDQAQGWCLAGGDQPVHALRPSIEQGLHHLVYGWVLKAMEVV